DIWAAVAYILSISKESPQAGSAAQPRPTPSVHPTAATPVNLPASLVGDPARGEALFFEAGERGCAGCHTIAGRGNPVGPALSPAASRDAHALLRNIVYPAASVDPAYRPVRLVLNGGETIRALKKEETETALRVWDLGGTPPVLRRVARADVRAMEPDSR